MSKQFSFDSFFNILIVTIIIFPNQTEMVHHRNGKFIKNQKDNNQCGHPIGMVSGKIVGGYDVGYYKYPWFVALYKYGMPYCGATLVTKKSIVTAAHCYQQYVQNSKGIENEYDLKMGTYNICNTHEHELKTYRARKVYIHERYAKEDPYFDIALIVLKENVKFEPACLPSKPYGSKSRPKEAIIAGYGVLKFHDIKVSCVMREARIRIYSDKDCKKMLHKADPEVENFVNAFCAGYLEGGVDACQVKRNVL
nr:transmembrane protease serine 11A-like [Onthophagus taurus]